MTTIFRTEQYTVLHCSSCGIGFGVPTDYEYQRRQDRATFHCPSGHRQWFPGKTSEARIEELKAQIAGKDDLLQSTRAERDKQWRLRRAAEGKARAVKRRVAAGVCPCCTRTFQNLAAHMKCKHPGFPQETSE